MRKKILALVFAAALLMALAVPIFGGTTPAFAKVHAVSQAGCSTDPAGEDPFNPNSGAIASGGNSPAGPIPVTASPFTNVTFPGQGGDFDGTCDVPPGPIS